MFVQVTTGSLMKWIRPAVGNRVMKWHIWEGGAAFVLAWLHPALLGLALGFDTVARLGGYAVWGKLGLVLLTAGVAATRAISRG